MEELLAERGITVDHVTVYCCTQRYTPLLIDAAGPSRHCPGTGGVWTRHLYRAIDQFGLVIDVSVSQKLDLAATRRSSPTPSSTAQVVE